MTGTNFDAFGEKIGSSLETDTLPSRALRWGERAGVITFWSLVAAILLTRAVYFDGDIASAFDHIRQASRSVLAAFGV